ncbi:MAG TPA: hypothetical protein VJG83_01405 [archaeon]|nr:hypothetical protein [archaeon]
MSLPRPSRLSRLQDKAGKILSAAEAKARRESARKIATLSKSLERQKQARAQASATIRQLREELVRARQQSESAGGRLPDIAAELERKKGMLEHALRENGILTQNLEQEQRAHLGTTGQKVAAGFSAREAQQRARRAQEKASRLTTRTTVMQSVINSLTALLRGRSKDLANTRANLANTRDELGIQTATAKQKAEQIESMRVQSQRLQSEIQTFQSQISNLQNERANAQRESNEANLKVADLTNRLSGAQSQFQAATETINRLSQSLTTEQQRHQLTREELARAAGELAAEKTTTNKQRDQLDRKSRVLGQRNATIKSLVERVRARGSAAPARVEEERSFVSATEMKMPVGAVQKLEADRYMQKFINKTLRPNTAGIVSAYAAEYARAAPEVQATLPRPADAGQIISDFQKTTFRNLGDLDDWRVGRRQGSAIRILNAYNAARGLEVIFADGLRASTANPQPAITIMRRISKLQNQ